MSKMSQGMAACFHGSDVEEAIESLLVQHRFREADVGKAKGHTAIALLKEQSSAKRFTFDEAVGGFAKQVRLCTGLHGNIVREDYLLYHLDWPDAMALSVKHQHKPGSATKKLEHLYHEIRECYPCRCAVLLDGPQFKPPIVARGNHHVVVSGGLVSAIMAGIGDLRTWLADGAKWPIGSASTLMFG